MLEEDVDTIIYTDPHGATVSACEVRGGVEGCAGNLYCVERGGELRWLPFNAVSAGRVGERPFPLSNEALIAVLIDRLQRTSSPATFPQRSKALGALRDALKLLEDEG